MTGPAVVRCLCSHAASQHTGGIGQCWSTVCGCRMYRAHEKPAPEARCEFSDLPVSGCAHCRGHSSADAPSGLGAADVLSRFEARYDGVCEACGGRFGEGDVIARLADGSGYACGECLE